MNQSKHFVWGILMISFNKLEDILFEYNFWQDEAIFRNSYAFIICIPSFTQSQRIILRTTKKTIFQGIRSISVHQALSIQSKEEMERNY